MSSKIQSKRAKADVMKLTNAGYDLEFADESRISDFQVLFHGPKETIYDGGSWKVHVILPVDYPYKSPSIGFTNRIYHPNIDDISGSVCLDVINQTWTPMFVFLPQLLRYPNPADPLNGAAAAQLLHNEAKYKCKVQEYIKLYSYRSETSTSLHAEFNSKYHSSQPINCQTASAMISIGAPSLAVDSHHEYEDGATTTASSLSTTKTIRSDEYNHSFSSVPSFYTPQRYNTEELNKNDSSDLHMSLDQSNLNLFCINGNCAPTRGGSDNELEEDVWETLSDVSEMSDL